jgi:hypothetical protein
MVPLLDGLLKNRHLSRVDVTVARLVAISTFGGQFVGLVHSS